MQVHFTVMKETFQPAQTAQLLPPIKAADVNMTSVLQTALGLNHEVFTSQTATFAPSQQCSAYDVVTFNSEDRLHVGQVWFHAQMAGQSLSCISRWQPAGSNQFRILDDPVLVPTEAIKDVCVFSKALDVATVVPFLYLTVD